MWPLCHSFIHSFMSKYLLSPTMGQALGVQG